MNPWDKVKTWDVYNITEKEIREIRNLCAEDGMELTPKEVEETIEVIRRIKEMT